MTTQTILLLKAAQENDVPVIDELAASQLDMNAQTHGPIDAFGVRLAEIESTTPLIVAVESGNLEAVQALLRAGAKPDVRDWDGMTALMHVGYSHGRSGSDDQICRLQQIVGLLLNAGANINATDRVGRSPLIHVARGCLDCEDRIIQLLIAAGADKAHTDECGYQGSNALETFDIMHKRHYDKEHPDPSDPARIRFEKIRQMLKPDIE
jgi:ankyrin repeat protein